MRQQAVLFAIAALTMLAADFSDSRAAGLLSGAVAVTPMGSINTPLGYPSPLPVSRRRSMMTLCPARSALPEVQVYRVVRPHIITVTLADTASDNSIFIDGRHEEKIIFGPLPDSEHGYRIAIVRGTTKSVAFFP